MLVLHSLLLLSARSLEPCLHHMFALLAALDDLNKICPAVDVLEKQEIDWPKLGENLKL